MDYCDACLLFCLFLCNACAFWTAFYDLLISCMFLRVCSGTGVPLRRTSAVPPVRDMSACQVQWRPDRARQLRDAGGTDGQYVRKIKGTLANARTLISSEYMVLYMHRLFAIQETTNACICTAFKQRVVVKLCPISSHV